MKNFSDIFKSSFLENVTAVSLTDMAITLLLSLCLGLFIFYVYKKSFAGVMYSSTFGVTLVALCMITSMTILAVTSNVVLSLGMVGALSIVRFRTAVKEPMDLVFLFWAIAVGIVLAAGMIPLAVVGSIVIGGVIVFLANKKTFVHPYILAITADADVSEDKLLSAIESNSKKHVLKSKCVKVDGQEFNYELRLNNENTGFINEINSIPGVKSAILVSYNGEYMG